MRDPLPLERLQGGAEALATLDLIQHPLGRGDCAVDRERVFEREASVWPSAAHVDAEPLDDLPPNFGHRDPQVHLVGPPDGERIDNSSTRTVGGVSTRAVRRVSAGADGN